jgi:hypothetical protein
MQMAVKKALGFTIPLVHARGVFNYDVGLMPYRHEVNTVGMLSPLSVFHLLSLTPSSWDTDLPVSNFLGRADRSGSGRAPEALHRRTGAVVGRVEGRVCERPKAWSRGRAPDYRVGSGTQHMLFFSCISAVMAFFFFSFWTYIFTDLKESHDKLLFDFHACARFAAMHIQP